MLYIPSVEGCSDITPDHGAHVKGKFAGGTYVNPERLTAESAYFNTKIPAMLPGYFVQPVRQGYKFYFAGTNQMRAPTPFGGAYESFVYTATPVDSAAGGRSLALYPDGQIYATADRRVPTKQDTVAAAR